MLRQAQRERIWGEHLLVPHPDTPASGVQAVSVRLRSSSRYGIGLRYRVEPARTLLIPDHVGGPQDGLWKSTCFELFVGPKGSAAYCEFNFAPAGGWAAYTFRGRRAGMAPMPLARPPRLVDGRDENRSCGLPGAYEFRAHVDHDAWPRGDAMLGVTAVIEETDGTKSYWALAHPDGPPDFHDPACFVLTLPAADRT